MLSLDHKMNIVLWSQILILSIYLDWGGVLVYNAGEVILIPHHTQIQGYCMYRNRNHVLLSHVSVSFSGCELCICSSCGAHSVPGRHRSVFHNLPVSPQTAAQLQTRMSLRSCSWGNGISCSLFKSQEDLLRKPGKNPTRNNCYTSVNQMISSQHIL